MNSREKLLLIIFSALIILFGGFKLLIEPSIKNLSALEAKHANALAAKSEIQSNLNLAQTIDQATQELENSIKLSSEQFFPDIQNDKIQQYFKSLADKTGISFESFIMTEKVASQILNNQLSESDGVTYPAKDAAQEILSESITSSNSDSAKSGETPVGLVELTTVAFQTNCTYEKLQTLLDNIKNSKRVMRVASVQFTSASAEGGAATDILTVNVSVECYGVKKILVQDSLSKNTLPKPSGKSNPFSR